MRVSVLLAASMMAAAPAWAQSTTVLGPRTTLAAHVMCADLLVPAMPAALMRIKGPQHHDQRLALSRGDVIVIGRTLEDGLAVGQRYFVRRLPTATQSHLPKEGGFVPVRTPGWVTITALDDVNAMARIDYACDDVETGDYLEPYAEIELPTALADVPPPDFSERVPILPGLEGRDLIGDGDMFSIARGTAHGVAVGARYAIYRDRKDGKPLVHIGEAIVTEPAATSAKVLLMTTVDVVSPSDIAVPRRPGAQH